MLVTCEKRHERTFDEVKVAWFCWQRIYNLKVVARQRYMCLK